MITSRPFLIIYFLGDIPSLKLKSKKKRNMSLGPHDTRVIVTFA